MISPPSSRKYIRVCILMGVLLAAFTGYKAYAISFTYDESATWLEQIYRSVWEIITYKYPNSSNHLFNTLYMRFASIYFGSSAFALRGLSWFSHIIYIFFSIKILQTLKNGWLIIPGFILLNVNPYLLDYFSLARGYGLALAMMITSIYYFILYIHRQKQWLQAVALLFGMLAVLANFSWLNYFLALAGALLTFNFILNYQKKQFFWSFLRSIVPMFVASALLFTIIFLPIKKLATTGQFFFGGKKGFWQDTIFSLVTDSIYIKSAGAFAWPLFLIVLIVFSLSVIFLFIKLIRAKSWNIPGVVYYLLLIPCIAGLSVELQHIILGTLYLTDRTALMFIPLYFLFVVFVLDELSSIRLTSFFVKTITIASCVLTTVFFLYVLNITGVREFFYDSSTEKMLTDLGKNVPEALRKPDAIKLEEPWIYVPTTNFYIKTKNLYWVRQINIYKKDEIPIDYYYMKNVDDNDRVQFKKEHKTILAEYPTTNTTLVKWKPD